MRVHSVNTSLQIIISLFSFGCTQLPKQIPKDFQLLIESTAIQPRANGNYSLMIKRKAIEDQFELIRNYDNTIRKLTDMNVLDGSTTTLTV